MPPIKLLYFTIRYLKSIQILGRIWYRFYRPSIKQQPAPNLRPLSGMWASPILSQKSLLSPWLFRFLNEEHELFNGIGWDDKKISKLWRYNLHYFDGLNSIGNEYDQQWQKDLLLRWVEGNSVGKGTGWEPYPTSIRLVNWVKWSLAGNKLPSNCLDSLAMQARWLEKNLEIHLLGNHLFTNSKALIFVGLFFSGNDADRWLKKGFKILSKEMREQVLDDGGHFERSPMYHALALEDMLDLMNICVTYKNSLAEKYAGIVSEWPSVIESMYAWMKGMCHQDGDISFFNDAALNIAPTASDICLYAKRQGINFTNNIDQEIIHFNESGYLRITRDDMVAILDMAPIGPDYLPGHGHADSLSFEMSLKGHRVIVNSGTSCYGGSSERLRQRKTSAHSTVTVDGEDSSEVWGGFRVARRAYVSSPEIVKNGKSVTISSSHNGYLRLAGKNIHKREWKVSDGSMSVTDYVTGEPGSVVARYHFHPNVKILTLSNDNIYLETGDLKIMIKVVDAKIQIKKSTWHPEFGKSFENSVLVLVAESNKITFLMSWE